MDHAEKKEQLLRYYGYPEEAIPRLLKEISALSYEKVEKLILPYHDMIADKS
ncbi:hypothetical protein [Priestia abyssalis]|uniref:hypothetical protein n=1 Tax=Priestia abyssalis TaxID=1221450 RepID=UPI0014747DFD|nr:hypothetical protein [Priestia abyssalis]